LRISAAAAAKYRMQGYHYHPVNEAKDEQEYGYEGDMALNQLATLTRCADMIKELLKPDTDMPEWVQSKITLATDYIQTAADYMYSEMKEEVELDESHKVGDSVTVDSKFFGKQKGKIVKVDNQSVHVQRNNKKYSEKYPHDSVMKEEFVQEGRPSQSHPLEGHDYHKKSNAELEYIAKDAHKAAEAMKSHNTTAENKYRDQANDSATVRHFRKTSGSPDWYKKKYGLKEEVEPIEELSNATLRGYADKARTDIQKTLPKLHTDAKAAGRIDKRVAGLAASTVAKVKNNMKKESTDSDGGPPTEAASTLTVTGQPKLNKTVGQTKLIPYVQEDKETKPPFDKPYTTTKAVVKDKSGAKHTPMSRARDLARKAMARNMKKQSYVAPNPFTVPEIDIGKAPKKTKATMAESRQLEIVREAMKVAKKKKEVTEAGTDKFIADPELSSQITKSNP
jgi:hypothetical protein